MPFLTKRSFSERDPIRLFAVGVVVAVVVGLASLNAGTIIRAVSYATYIADFADSGGLSAGDEVWISGVKVGLIDSVTLDGEQVAAEFSVEPGHPLGDLTRASVQTETVLGKRILVVEPAGLSKLPNRSVIPLSRTETPYNLEQILSRLTSKSEALDKVRLESALNVIGSEFAHTQGPLHEALDGVNRLSETIASRDRAVRELFDHAQAVTGVLAQRSNDVITIVTQGNLLLSELNDRREEVQQLIKSVTDVVHDLDGVVQDNEGDLASTLDALRSILSLLNRNDKNLGAAIHGLNIYVGSLGEAVGSGSWFFASVQNLVPPANLIPGLPADQSSVRDTGTSEGGAIHGRADSPRSRGAGR